MNVGWEEDEWNSTANGDEWQEGMEKGQERGKQQEEARWRIYCWWWMNETSGCVCLRPLLFVLWCWISLVLRPCFIHCPLGNVKFQVQSSFRREWNSKLEQKLNPEILKEAHGRQEVERKVQFILTLCVKSDDGKMDGWCWHSLRPSIARFPAER